MDNYSNYDFNSDNEIPLEVLRARYLGKGGPKGDRPSPMANTAVVDKPKRVLDAIMMLATLFISIVTIFGMTTFAGDTVTGFNFIFIDDTSLLQSFIELVTGGNLAVTDFPSALGIALTLWVWVSYFSSAVAFFITAIYTAFYTVSHFIKKETRNIERRLITLIHRALPFYLFAALMMGGYDVFYMYEINSTLTLSLVVGAAVVLAVAITRAIIRRKAGATPDKHLPLHITSYIASVALFVVIASRPLFNFLSTTVVRLISFILDIELILGDAQLLISLAVGLAAFIVAVILMKRLLKSIYRDALRLITSGETLDSKTRSDLLNEDFNKKPFRFFTIATAIAYVLSVFLFDLGYVTESFASYKTMYLIVALVSLAADILTSIFSKKAK